jgi:hypothetical protein
MSVASFTRGQLLEYLVYLCWSRWFFPTGCKAATLIGATVRFPPLSFSKPESSPVVLLTSGQLNAVCYDPAFEPDGLLSLRASIKTTERCPSRLSLRSIFFTLASSSSVKKTITLYAVAASLAFW